MNVYLDKENIKKITVNKNSKLVEIQSVLEPKYLLLAELNLDSLSKRPGFGKNKIESLILNGEIVSDEQMKNTKIEISAITNIQLLTQEQMNNSINCRMAIGDFFLINTKQ
ncbi:MAG: hypothetical protein CFE23_16500 [Flavobacterium sp. BFFFF1]|nr:MAG: hypothetical protein CFE23_16500 [Flavobacterium sp. BFFFF1]